MSKMAHSPFSNSQTGGVTILVALSLLVLLTVAAVSMSRNSFREVILSGTTRQGAMVRNVADAGIEWSIYWLDLGNASSATLTGAKLQTMKTWLLQNDLKAGRAWDVIGGADIPYTVPPSVTSLPTDQIFSTVPNHYQGYSLAFTRMGKLPITNTSQGVVQGSFTPAQGGISKQAPDLWSVRSDAQVQLGSGLAAPTFNHSKEAWISTPVQ